MAQAYPIASGRRSLHDLRGRSQYPSTRANQTSISNPQFSTTRRRGEFCNFRQRCQPRRKRQRGQHYRCAVNLPSLARSPTFLRFSRLQNPTASTAVPAVSMTASSTSSIHYCPRLAWRARPNPPTGRRIQQVGHVSTGDLLQRKCKMPCLLVQKLESLQKSRRMTIVVSFGSIYLDTNS